MLRFFAFRVCVYIRISLPREKRKNVKDDTQMVLDQAVETLKWIDTVRFVLPEGEWSTDLAQ